MAFGAIALAALPLGTAGFFVAVAAASAAYGGALYAARRAEPRRGLLIALALITLAMRAPMALAPVGAASDMLRYVWDARVQRAGLSPYQVIPSRPEYAHLHTAETRRMNNVNIPSPYPPGAQIFFRMATVFSESARAIKLALVACDLAIVAVLFFWLRSSGRNPLMAVAYAWNPLVILEIAHSGHIDAAAVLAVAIAAFALARRRIAISVVALAAGIAIKFLPLVLVPLWWGRVRLRHAALGAGVLAALYLLFTDFTTGTLPVGSVTNMIRGFRFNGPIFKVIAFLTTPWMATATGFAAGVIAAALIRRSRLADDPAAFAWPMAAALVCSPVIYPWYLLWLTPFFISTLTWPLIVWSLMIPATYIVWQSVHDGGLWAVPIWMGFLEYAVLAGTTAVLGRTVTQVSAGKHR